MKKDSIKFTQVVEFSHSRKRYERYGILVEKESLRKARMELKIEDDDGDHDYVDSLTMDFSPF